MNTRNLKQEVLERIAVIDDQSFLEVIKSLLDYKQSEPVMVLPPDLKKRLLMASEEAKKGNFISEEEMDEQVASWLREE